MNHSFTLQKEWKRANSSFALYKKSELLFRSLFALFSKKKSDVLFFKKSDCPILQRMCGVAISSITCPTRDPNLIAYPRRRKGRAFNYGPVGRRFNTIGITAILHTYITYCNVVSFEIQRQWMLQPWKFNLSNFNTFWHPTAKESFKIWTATCAWLLVPFFSSPLTSVCSKLSIVIQYCKNKLYKTFVGLALTFRPFPYRKSFFFLQRDSD